MFVSKSLQKTALKRKIIVKDNSTYKNIKFLSDEQITKFAEKIDFKKRDF